MNPVDLLRQARSREAAIHAAELRLRERAIPQVGMGPCLSFGLTA